MSRSHATLSAEYAPVASQASAHSVRPTHLGSPPRPAQQPAPRPGPAGRGPQRPRRARAWRLARHCAVGARRSRHARATSKPRPRCHIPSPRGRGCPPLIASRPRVAAQPASGPGSALANARPFWREFATGSRGRVPQGCRRSGRLRGHATRTSRPRHPRQETSWHNHLASTSSSARLVSPANDGTPAPTLGSEAEQRTSIA